MQYQNYIDSINNYIEKNNTKKAIEYSQLLIDEFPKKEGGYDFLWKIYSSIGEKNNSLKAFSSLINLYDNDFTKLNGIGAKLLELDAIDEALICFEKVINSFKKINDLEPNLRNVLITSYNGLIKIHKDKHDFNNALKYTDKILDITNNDINFLLLKATFYVNSFKYNAAIKVLKDILIKDPNYHKSYHLLGKIYSRIGLWEDSYKNYEKALEISPDDKDIESDLSKVTGKFSSEILSLEEVKSDMILDDKNFISEFTFSRELSEVFKNLGKNNLLAGNFKTGINYLKLVEGYIEIDLPEDDGLFVAKKVNIKQKQNPNFFGSWEINDFALCDDIINIFEKNSSSHHKGTTVSGIDETSKLSIDLSIDPNSLSLKKYQRINDYFYYLKKFFQLYINEWDIIKLKNDFKVGTFNIQKYNPGGHFKKPHFERMSAFTQHRYFAFMSYLNDVEEGGETVFPYFDLSIRPTKGHTLIWPADWTHMHFGDEVKKGVKYIITGWIESHN